jgi:hypothetical protein
MNRALNRIVFRTSPRRFLVWCFALALLIRVGFVVLVGIPEPPGWQEHTVIAHNIHAGYGFGMHWWYTSLSPERRAIMSLPPTFEGSFQPPLNPYLIAGFYALFGETRLALWLVMLLFALINAFLPLTTYWVARMLTDERRSRLAAIVSLAFLPAAYSVITYSGAPMYIISAMIFLGGCVAIWKDPSRIRNYVIAGIAGGITGLLRSEFLILGTILLLVTAFASRGRSRPKKLVGYFVLALAVHVAIGGIWVVRNYNLYGHVLLTGTHGWHEIWRGNNDHASGTYHDDFGGSVCVDTVRFRRVTARIDSVPYNKYFEYRIDHIFKEEAITYIKSHPVETLLLSAKRATYLFSFDLSHPFASNPLYSVIMTLVSLFSVVGMIRLLRDNPDSFTRSPTFIILVYWMLYVAEISISQMMPRYQIYLFATILPITGVGVDQVLDWLRGFRDRKITSATMLPGKSAPLGMIPSRQLSE